jgi:predicted transcriptional regulator of viral defense system
MSMEAVMGEPDTSKPSWNTLFDTAASQDGLFTSQQAADAGYSPQLLMHHVRRGRLVRLRRGLYRLVHFPACEHEDLAAAWLWSERAGVVSHHTALALHALSDVLPAHIHVTLPSAWRRRRFRVPAGVVLHHADVPPADRSWFGAVPTTNPRRTLNDCARAELSPELLRLAALQAVRRGLVAASELRDVEQALEPFGGLA